MPTKHNTNLFTRAIARPEGFLAGIFASLILLGTILLSLPITHTRAGISVFDALFTSTSAVCVTGLVVVDTGQDFNLMGQMVILLLIQLGGLGIMTFAAFAMQVIGHKLSFRSQAVLNDMFYQQNAAAQFRKNLKWVVIFTLVIEAIGAILLFGAINQNMPQAKAVYIAIFHSISAFCNAGFSPFSDSLITLRGNLGFMTIISILIVLGGLGYTVILELLDRCRRRLTRQSGPVVWSLNTKVVLKTSCLLILIGAGLLYIIGSTDDDSAWSSRAGNAVFQSITARTAGFNTMDIGNLPTTSLLWLVLLMFVGGSPGSCAGGIKTTSLAIWVARLRARLGLREDVTIGGRRIPVDLVRRTGLLLGVAAVYNLVGVLILSITEMANPQVRLEDILFEQISAFGTVGLSTGLTPMLSTVGKLWIILTMFVGRLGPITIALVMMDRRPAMVRMPEERLMIG